MFSFVFNHFGTGTHFFSDLFSCEADIIYLLILLKIYRYIFLFFLTTSLFLIYIIIYIYHISSIILLRRDVIITFNRQQNFNSIITFLLYLLLLLNYKWPQNPYKFNRCYVFKEQTSVTCKFAHLHIGKIVGFTAV